VTARVQLPAALREYTAGAAEIDVDAPDVDTALREIATRFPALRRHLFTDRGELRGFVRVYLNADDIGASDRGGATPLRPGDTLTIVPSIAGGAVPADTFAPAEVARYARHITLPEIGWEGQRRLKEARVIIIGAGGLGSPASLYLAAAGVGTIGLADFDVVDTSNLQRQVIYGSSDIGERKVRAAARRLRDVNPYIAIIEHDERLTSANALDVLAPYDIVIDGTDNFPTRYLVNDACVLLRKPYVYGSILRFEGQVSVFDAVNGPCYRCLFREPPPPGLVPSCAEGGVLGVLPGIIGSLQALEAIKRIAGTGQPLIGRLVLFDALTFRWRELGLRRDPACAVCGTAPVVTALIDYDEFCAPGAAAIDAPQPGHSLPEITPAELRHRLDRGERISLIDVREPFEWDIANLGAYGARLIPLDQIPDRRAEIDPEADVVLYCRSGSRSAGALRQLRAHGYQRVTNLKGGLRAWAEEVDPFMPTY
jgi:adenylyltransferase/sulfurtransferase